MSKQNSLGLFFTINTSIKTWHTLGLLDREKTIYEELLSSNTFSKIYWFTYGPEDNNYSKYLIDSIIIVPKPKIFYGFIGSLIYSFLMPFIQKKYINKCDILKTNQMMGSWSAVISKKLYKITLFIRTGYTASIFFKNQGKKIWYKISLMAEKFSFKNADYSSVSSEADKKYIQKRYKINNINVIHNFIDTKLFNDFKYNKNKDIIYVGRLTKQKNLFSLFKALKGSDITLDIYGKGELKEKLMDYSKSNNINVNFHKSVNNSELPKILNNYKIFVLCSYYEGMPKSLLEAMSCGLACLGTDVTGINEVIEHNNNGWLVNTDPESIKNGIRHLLNNKILRNRLATQARQTIENNFSISEIIKQEKSLYNTSNNYNYK